ncbi:uncharacterized protein CDV56_103786 [Aspergillus thermomutatus]|uniref:Uncharacterized protein n=1 Tax=Aspergillus thermomutatus TaxID=41047 RepID=A0A397G1Y1_ASPTH|nr:uncharacterized protein CDV56_103786 [Aspergillus thermomutatus]RHZ45042.1 hypothetical protein CDV56_103786 [Aspergillus thermomutatus]
MATLDSLKSALRQEATATASFPMQPLSDTQYSDGFHILIQGSGRTTYQDIIIPRLSQVLSPLFNSASPCLCARNWARPEERIWIPARPPETEGSGTGAGMSGSDEKFDVILFCHTMYGMKPKSTFIEQVLEMLVERPEGGMVVVFHRERTLHLNVLDCFAPFVTGFVTQDVEADKAIQVEWQNVADILVAAVETHPSPLCYLHLLQGGGAVSDVAADATAFGCRDWDFACVVTSVWPRDQDKTKVARGAVRGVYGADLGPDPRDTALAAKAFGPNRPRLAGLKQSYDPRNVLAYACPLPKPPMEQKLIILVTGESCAGKDYYADIWVSVFITCTHKSLTARAGQVRHRPWLLEEHFLNVVYGAAYVDVLLITGMRDEAPVTALSHLVPDSRLIEVRVKASEETRRVRRGCQGVDDDGDNNEDKDNNNGRSNLTALDYRPSLIFDNDATGSQAAKRFAEHYLLAFFHEDLQRLANMVRPVPNFPRPGIEFRHVLDISYGDWAKVNVVACSEAGGFVYAAALALRVDVPLAFIREAGKLPQAIISVLKSTSHYKTLFLQVVVVRKGLQTLLSPNLPIVLYNDIGILFIYE